MDAAFFRALCCEASKLAVVNRDRIGQMRLTQKRGNEPTIREPEMLHAFCRTLDQPNWKKPYGIEVPTDGRFRFVTTPGDRRVKARHDLVFLDGDVPVVLVELKREQPSGNCDGYPAISKDLRKLLLERAPGKAMFHICHASDRGTIPAVTDKYRASIAFAKASIEADGLSINDTGWFALMILVLYDRNNDGQACLHTFISTSVAELLDMSPIFPLERFNSQFIR